MVHRGRSGRLRLAGKLQQLQADLAGPVANATGASLMGCTASWRSCGHGAPRGWCSWREMMRVALCAAAHHGLARGLDNVAISCFSGACRLVTAAGPPAPHGAGWECTALSELKRWTLAEAQGSLGRQLVWVYAKAERASGDVRQRTPRQAPTRDHFRGGPYATLCQQRPRADVGKRPTCPLKPTNQRPCNISVCFIRRPTCERRKVFGECIDVPYTEGEAVTDDAMCVACLLCREVRQKSTLVRRVM